MALAGSVSPSYEGSSGDSSELKNWNKSEQSPKTVYFDQIPSERQTGLNIPQIIASARNKFWRSGFLWALAPAQGFRVWSIVVEYK